MHQAFSISILFKVFDYSSDARHCNAVLCASEGAKLQLRRPLMTHIECNYINCICLGLFSFISVKSSINIFWNAALPKPFFFLLLDSEMFNNFQHIAKKLNKWCAVSTSGNIFRLFLCWGDKHGHIREILDISCRQYAASIRNMLEPHFTYGYIPN